MKILDLICMVMVNLKNIIRNSHGLINFFGWESNKNKIYENIDILLITAQ